MKPTLTKKPNYNYRNLLIKFAHGEPLAADELNFLYWHEKELSSKLLDPITKYYLKIYRANHAQHHSFLTPHEIMNKDDIQRLKKRIKIMLSEKRKHVEFTLSAKEFEILKKRSHYELIFYHGNQYLTGAPFFPGGIPHVVFFQWGNNYGVARNFILPLGRALKGYVMIHIEGINNRHMHQFVDEYIKQHKDDLRVEQQFQQHHQPQPKQPPTKSYKSPFDIPTLSLSKNTHNDDE